MFVPTTFAISNHSVLTPQMEFGDFVLTTIAIIVLFAGIFSILYILWGGVLLILSGGKDDKIKPAINSIRYALIGLALIVVSIFVFPMLARLLNLDVEKYSSPDRIFQQIKIIGDKIFNTNKSSKLRIDDRGRLDGPLPDDFSDL